MDKTLYARGNFEECTVIGHYHYTAIDLVTNLEVSIQGIPGMWHKLLEAEGDALLLVVEVEDNDIKLLVKLYYF